MPMPFVDLPIHRLMETGCAMVEVAERKRSLEAAARKLEREGGDFGAVRGQIGQVERELQALLVKHAQIRRLVARAANDVGRQHAR